MSSPRPSLTFRDSLDTSAGETTKILHNEPNSNITNKYVTFSNDPIVYYYEPEYPSNKSLKMNYSDISSPEVPIVYLPKNNKCNDTKTFMIYFLPIITIITCIILTVIFFILYFN